jgi:hypothetical protein
LLRVLNDDRKEQRVKPDLEVHPLAEVDYEKEPTRVSQPAQPTLQQAHTCAR